MASTLDIKYAAFNFALRFMQRSINPFGGINGQYYDLFIIKIEPNQNFL